MAQPEGSRNPACAMPQASSYGDEHQASDEPRMSHDLEQVDDSARWESTRTDEVDVASSEARPSDGNEQAEEEIEQGMPAGGSLDVATNELPLQIRRKKSTAPPPSWGMRGQGSRIPKQDSETTEEWVSRWAYETRPLPTGLRTLPRFVDPRMLSGRPQDYRIEAWINERVEDPTRLPRTYTSLLASMETPPAGASESWGNIPIVWRTSRAEQNDSGNEPGITYAIHRNLSYPNEERENNNSNGAARMISGEKLPRASASTYGNETPRSRSQEHLVENNVSSRVQTPGNREQSAQDPETLPELYHTASGQAANQFTGAEHASESTLMASERHTAVSINGSESEQVGENSNPKVVSNQGNMAERQSKSTGEWRKNEARPALRGRSPRTSTRIGEHDSRQEMSEKMHPSCIPPREYRSAEAQWSGYGYAEKGRTPTRSRVEFAETPIFAPDRRNNVITGNPSVGTQRMPQWKERRGVQRNRSSSRERVPDNYGYTASCGMTHAASVGVPSYRKTTVPGTGDTFSRGNVPQRMPLQQEAVPPYGNEDKSNRDANYPYPYAYPPTTRVPCAEIPFSRDRMPVSYSDVPIYRDTDTWEYRDPTARKRCDYAKSPCRHQHEPRVGRNTNSRSLYHRCDQGEFTQGPSYHRQDPLREGCVPFSRHQHDWEDCGQERGHDNWCGSYEREAMGTYRGSTRAYGHEEDRHDAHGERKRYSPSPRLPYRDGNTGNIAQLRQYTRLRAEPYDGSQPWEDYLLHFNVIAHAMQWNEEESVTMLAAALRGSALAVLSTLTMEQCADWSQVVGALTARFGRAHLRQVNGVELKLRRQKPKEDLATFATTIRKLVMRAFPECPVEAQERIAVNHFVDGIQDLDVQDYVRMRGSTNLDRALIAALECEANRRATRAARPMVRAAHKEGDQ